MRRRSPFSAPSQQSAELPTIFSDVAHKFAEGAIQCIKLRNFMTFEKMTISPSPGLNLIIGPNGTGKSSIICAIGLGLGSSPQILARTAKISGFIRHGCECAKIKILLTSNPSFWVYRRIGADNTSQWKMKNVDDKRWKVTSSADVLVKIQSLHIQLDNLCMFLPQERVKEFSTLRPNQLLSATEQAINKETYDAHLRLIRDFQQLRDSTTKLGDYQQNLEKYQAQVDQMKNDVNRFNQAKECKAQITRLEQKIPWVVYQVERDARDAIKKLLHQKVKEYKEIGKEKITPLSQQIEKLKKQRGNSTKAREDVAALMSATKTVQNQIFTNGNKLQNAKGKLEVVENELKEKLEKIKHIEVFIRESVEQATDGESIEEMRKRRHVLQKNLERVRLEEGRIRQEKSTIDGKIRRKHDKLKVIEQKLRAHENQKAKFMEFVRKVCKRTDVYELYQFIESKRNTFIGEVYGPLCAEMMFENPRNADIIERVCENRFLFSFVCDNETDYTVLDRFVRDRHMSQITLMKTGENTRRTQRRPRPDLSQYGFTAYCDQLFQAPDLVKNVLIAFGGIDRVPVGGNRAVEESGRWLIDNVFTHELINRYFGEDTFFTIYASRDGGSPTVTTRGIGKSRIWRENMQSDDKNELIEKQESIRRKISNLEAEQREVRQRVDSFKGEIAEATRQLQDIKDQISERSKIESRVKQVKDKKKELEKECESMPRRKNDLAKKQAELAEANMTLVEEWRRALRKVFAKIRAFDEIIIREQDLENQISELQEKLDEEKSKYASLEQEILELNEEKTQKEELIKRRKKEAEEICPLTEENQAMMKQLSGDLDVLRAELAHLKSRYASLSQINPQIAQRYAEAERKRDETQLAIDSLQERVNTMKLDLDRRFDDWKKSMNEDVEKIDQEFQKLMETCNYRGEVKLDWDAEDRIETYRLNLLVAFNRFAKLSVLSSTRQSGGEKSVTTLMYLLALQGCTKFPFRVVDEINQGMDEVNDRNTFFQVMSYAMRQQQASQYFLVTPKLLPQLDLMEGVTVLVVVNGPFVPDELSRPITFDNSFGAD